VKPIPVRDENGDHHTVYEFADRRFLREVRRWKLDSGETVQAVNENTFTVIGTGECLTRVG
jgi:hypothetical protein